MGKYINKSALVAEIEKKKIPFKKDIEDGVYPTYLCALMDFEDFINTLEVKEAEEDTDKYLSEEDEKLCASILNDLRQGVIPDEEDIDWLKSLKDRVKSQNRWKPSDEQMETLELIINSHSLDAYHLGMVQHLYNGLKTLKE